MADPPCDTQIGDPCVRQRPRSLHRWLSDGVLVLPPEGEGRRLEGAAAGVWAAAGEPVTRSALIERARTEGGLTGAEAEALVDDSLRMLLEAGLVETVAPG